MTKTKIANNFLYLLQVFFMLGLVNTAYRLVVGLVFDPVLMGEFSTIFSWVTLLSIPIANGIAPAVNRFIAANSVDDIRKIELIGFKLSTIYLLGIVVLFAILGALVFKLNFLAIVAIILYLVVNVFHFLARKSMQGQERFKELFVIESVTFIAFVILSVLAVLIGYYDFIPSKLTLFLLVVPIIVFNLLAVIILVFNVNKINIRKIKNTLKPHNLTYLKGSLNQSIIRFSFFIGIGAIFGMGTSQIQIIISNLYLDGFEVGVLGFWQAAATPIHLIAVSLASLLLSRISNLLEHRKELARKVTNQFNWILTLTILPLFGIFVLFIYRYPHVIDFITLDKYNTTTYWLVVVYAFALEVNRLIMSPSRSYISSSEKHVKINPLNYFVYFLVTVVLWILLVPTYGINGFAIGILLGSISSHIFLLIYTYMITKRSTLPIGAHTIVLIPLIVGIGCSLLLIDYVRIPFLWALWGLISLICIPFGLKELISLLRDEELSIRYQ